VAHAGGGIVKLVALLTEQPVSPHRVGTLTVIGDAQYTQIHLHSKYNAITIVSTHKQPAGMLYAMT
jgi:hypothetical protein